MLIILSGLKNYNNNIRQSKISSLMSGIGLENTRRNDALSSSLCLLGTFFLTVFGIKSYLSGLPSYGMGLIIFAFCTFLVWLQFQLTKNWLVFQAMICLGFSFLYLFLLASGGQENTGLLWCYAYPLIVFSLFGSRLGALLVGVVLILSCVILYVPDLSFVSHGYTDDIKYRFTGSILFVTAMGYMMENSRMQAQRKSDEANAVLKSMAHRDELTGLFNRRGIKECHGADVHLDCSSQPEMTVAVCDLDHFKKINDQYGHDVGDEVLKLVANKLKTCLRESDLIGRWGGEEFLILLPKTTLKEGYVLIDRVRQVIAECEYKVGDELITLSISSGLSSTRYYDSWDSLIKAADKHLYRAKNQGRNCTCTTEH